MELVVVAEMLSKADFIDALWETYKAAKFEGLEWKWVEWVRDPLVRKLGLTKAKFNGLLEQVMLDSFYDKIPWTIQVDTDVTERRLATIRRMTPVVIQGVRVYVIRMAPNPDLKIDEIPPWDANPEEGPPVLPEEDASSAEAFG